MKNEMNDAKNELRRRFRALRRNMSAEDKRASDEKISRTLLESPLWAKAETVLVYCSLPAEIDTAPLIEAAWAQGKTVAAPVSLPETHTMLYRVIRSAADLQTGTYGIAEPKETCPQVVPDEKSLCLVPAFAYDGSGFRLGYGGGYYDRFLAEFSGTAVGLCRAAWLRDELPTDSCDRPVQAVILEDRTIFPTEKLLL